MCYLHRPVGSRMISGECQLSSVVVSSLSPRQPSAAQRPSALGSGHRAVGLSSLATSPHSCMPLLCKPRL